MSSKDNANNRANQLNPNNAAYSQSRGKDKTPMTEEAASRIQSNADKTGTNQDFKARAMEAASRKKK